MSDATFGSPDLDSFCRLDRLGLTVTGQRVDDDGAVLACRVVEPDGCAMSVAPKGCSVTRSGDGWRTSRWVGGRRRRSSGCAATPAPVGHVWRQDTTAVAGPRSKLSVHAVLWALRAVVIDRQSMARVAATLGVSWHTANTAVLGAGRELLINDPTRLDGVCVIGVDQHCWRHPQRRPGHPRAPGHHDVHRPSGERCQARPARGG